MFSTVERWKFFARPAVRPLLRLRTGSRASLAVNLLDYFLEVILHYIDDADFSFGILDRIAGMGGIDHDRLAELAPDRSGWRLGGIGWAEHIQDFTNPIHALV